MSDGESSAGELIDYGTAPEFYVDDWCTPIIRYGVLTIAGYRTINRQRVVVVRIAMPAATVAGAQERVAQAMEAASITPTHSVFISEKPKVLS